VFQLPCWQHQQSVYSQSVWVFEQVLVSTLLALVAALEESLMMVALEVQLPCLPHQQSSVYLQSVSAFE
jgi:hypothetical protein